MLQLLPPDISNLIAAGEVVTRPAAVLKELLENAVDAGATAVSVVITDAGRTLIQVIDDGCGMSQEEALLCFERHATSKIASAADLERISTFGFRGEALASIAAVAQVTLRTRREQDEVGSETQFAASALVSQSPAAVPKGSSFAVRNLFYNVPARRKFLKSDNAELKHLLSEFFRVAIARPAIAFTLSSNGKELYRLPVARNNKQRIYDLFGRDLASGLTDIATETSIINVRGYIGAPEDARRTAGNQFFFVNGRYFRSPYLHKAVCRPYEKLIPEGSIPSYFIFLETDASRIDVNIHPAKTEIKFEDEAVVFDIVSACVREGIGRSTLAPSIDFDCADAPDIPTIHSSGRGRGSGYVRPPKMGYDPLFNPFDIDRKAHFDTEWGLGTTADPFAEPFADSAGDPAGDSVAGPDGKPFVGPAGDSAGGPFAEPRPGDNYASEAAEDSGAGRLFADSGPAESDIMVWQGRYIIFRCRDALRVVSIYRARLRVFYERYLESLVESSPAVVPTLFPVMADLPPEDCQLLEECADSLPDRGFDIRPFGQNSVVVHGLPEGYLTDEHSVKEAVAALVEALREERRSDDPKALLAASMARSAASMRKGDIPRDEALQLLRDLFRCHHPAVTPDGHRTMFAITAEEIEKRL